MTTVIHMWVVSQLHRPLAKRKLSAMNYWLEKNNTIRPTRVYVAIYTVSAWPTEFPRSSSSRLELTSVTTALCMPLLVADYKSGVQNHIFRGFRNLTAILTTYIFGQKHDIHKQASALQTTKALLCRLKTTRTLIHKRLKLEVSFHTPSVNSAFHFIARIRIRRSANGTQPNYAKRWTVGHANNLT